MPQHHKIFTISYCQEQNRFLDDEFTQFIQTHSILEMDKKFFARPWPCWTVFVTYGYAVGGNSSRPDSVSGRANGKSAWLDQLTPEDRELAEQVRNWRRRKAGQEKQSDFMYLTNAQIVEITRRKPTSLQALREISGIGSIKAQKHGEEILDIVRHFLARPVSPAQAQTPKSQSASEPQPSESSVSETPIASQSPQSESSS